MYGRCEVAVFDALANNGIGCRVVRIGHLRLRYRVRSLAVYFRGVIRLLFACFFRGVALRDEVVVIVLHVLRLPLCKPDARTDSPCELVYRHRVRHGRLPHKAVDSLVLRLRDLAYKLPAVVLDKVIDKTKLRVEQRASIFGKKVGCCLLYCRVNKRRVMVNDEFAVILLPLREVARRKLALEDCLTQFCVCYGVLLCVYLLVQEGGELWTLSVDKRVEFIKRRLLAHPKHPPFMQHYSATSSSSGAISSVSMSCPPRPVSSSASCRSRVSLRCWARAAMSNCLSSMRSGSLAIFRA